MLRYETNTFRWSEKNPCGNRKKIPQKRQTYRKRTKYQVEAEKVPETGKIPFGSGKIRSPAKLAKRVFRFLIFSGELDATLVAFRLNF